MLEISLTSHLKSKAPRVWYPKNRLESPACFVYANAVMKKLPVIILTPVISLLLLQGTLRAQSPAAAKDNEAAYDLLSNADYKGAADAYQGIITGYPTDILVQSATIQLGVCQFYLGEFDKALESLEKSKTGPTLSPEQTLMIDNLHAQILAAKGMSLPLTDEKRKGIFEQAIKSYTDFIAKYPKSSDVEGAAYGRALCEYQIADYEKAAADLRENIQKFSTSTTIESSKNLLAITLATQGGELLTKEGGDQAAGLELLKQAEDLLGGIIKGKKDLALVNDANFQLGEILFMRAAFSPEADRKGVYEQSAAAYMAVLPKEDIVAMQEDKVKSYGPQKVAALRAKNIPLKNKLDKENERELKKLAEISAKPDQIAQALLKLGEIFFNAGRYNESRVVINHVGPFLTSDDDKMRALYYKTMGYVVQNAMDPALKGYEEFQGAYKGKPLAENLPFMIGNMILAQGDNAGSIRYFEESIQSYPEGRLSGLSVAQKAQAQLGLKQYDEALKTFQDSLQKNPSPEVGVVAQFGIANIYRDTSKWDEAIDAFKRTVEKYPGTPQALESSYWIGACTQQKGDNAAAIPLLEEFLKTNSDTPFTPLATFVLGNAQIAAGQNDVGVATLAKVAEQFPDSPPAPFTYFSRAQVFATTQKVDEINKLMREFIEKYPKDDKIYFAYNSIGQNSSSAGNIDQALATWREFVERYPEHPKAPSALVTISELLRASAERLATNYTSLNEADRVKWKDAVDGSSTTIETLLAKYPQSSDVSSALQSFLSSQRMLIRSGLKDDAAVEAAFQTQADQATDPGARSKILFVLAGFIAEKDKPRALAKMSEAYNAQVVYGPKDLDVYGLALVDSGKLDEAQAVFEKLAADYPVPAGGAPNSGPPLVQEAQATSIFGKGRVAQQRGQTAEAGQFFQQLKIQFPWSPKVLEADYGIAQSLRSEKKPDEAMALLGGIIRAQNATAELRANSFLLYGHIMKDKMAAEADPKKKAENCGAAIDFFMKIPQFYSGVPGAAAEGLWEGGQLLEQQAATLTEESKPKKSEQLARAKACYSQIVKDFPSDKNSEQAKQRLQALGGN
jgi:TolA-binding protein